jgi:hypothetical protein
MSSYFGIVQQIVARFRDIEAKTILIVARFSTIIVYFIRIFTVLNYIVGRDGTSTEMIEMVPREMPTSSG